MRTSARFFAIWVAGARWRRFTGPDVLDTTMGFTPMDGIAMCTRSGAIDPGIMLHLLRHGTDLDSLEQTLNKRSGLPVFPAFQVTRE